MAEHPIPPSPQAQRGLRIIMTGGGSGGHITPILAVAYQLKLLRPDCEIIYVGQTGDRLGDIPAKDPHIDQVYTVRAGKLRRYHGEGARQLLDLPTVAKNVRDVGYVVAGLNQSVRLLKRLQPDVVFIKGGFVGVPVGLAAARLGIPYVTHDSDALPGLANRIVARWASVHAVALPKEVYTNYPPAKTVTVGVPISHEYQPRNRGEVATLKRKLGLPATARVVLVTGGGLGATNLNEAVITGAPQLLDRYPEVVIIHLAGRAHVDDVSKKYNDILTEQQRTRVLVEGFITNVYDYSAVADVVVTRAGGNSIAEFAAQAKPCIVVPNPVLTGGHQLKNARVLAERQAVEIVDESELLLGPDTLRSRIAGLLDDPVRAADLGAALQTFARPDAAERLAVVLLDVADKQSHGSRRQRRTRPTNSKTNKRQTSNEAVQTE